MKHICTLLLFFGLLAAGTMVRGQTTPCYDVPEGVTLSTAEDCSEHTSDFVKATDYLMAAPVDVPNRREVNAFAMMWMSHNCEVSLSVNADMLTPLLDDGNLMILYMAGWSRYGLRTHDTDNLQCNVVGIRAVVNYYKVPAHKVPPSKALDRLVKLEREGKLEAEVAAMLKKHHS